MKIPSLYGIKKSMSMPTSPSDILKKIIAFNALLKLTQDMRKGIGLTKVTIPHKFDFDFSKAFDTISPTRLLNKIATSKFLPFSPPVVTVFQFIFSNTAISHTLKTT